MTRHPLLQAALARIAECPDGRGAGFSSDCVALDCGWSHGITADRNAVHRALEDHALDTGHVVFHTVVAPSTPWTSPASGSGAGWRSVPPAGAPREA